MQEKESPTSIMAEKKAKGNSFQMKFQWWTEARKQTYKSHDY